MERKYLTKLKVYLAITVASALSLLFVSLYTGHFNEHLQSILKERVSDYFITETIVLIALILLGSLLGILARARYKKSSRDGDGTIINKEESFLHAWIEEMPRAAYLLGALMSSALYVASLFNFKNRAYLDGTLFLAAGLTITFLFGAWGHLLDLLVDTTIERIWKSFALVISVTIVAVLAPPFSLLPAGVLFGFLYKKFELGQPS